MSYLSSSVDRKLSQTRHEDADGYDAVNQDELLDCQHLRSTVRHGALETIWKQVAGALLPKTPTLRSHLSFGNGMEVDKCILLVCLVVFGTLCY